MKKSRASVFVEIQAVIFQPCKNVGAAQTPYGAKRCSVAFGRGKTGNGQVQPSVGKRERLYTETVRETGRLPLRGGSEVGTAPG